MRQTAIKFGKHLFWELLIILGGLFLYMITVQTIGYLPFSDRPGPGWYKDEFSISWSEINYTWNFIWFLGIYVLVELILVYGLFRLIRLIGFNKIAFAVSGGLIIGFLTLYNTLGIGWYIAIDSSSVFAGGILGATYGVTLFPNYLRPNKEKNKSTKAQQRL